MGEERVHKFTKGGTALERDTGISLEEIVQGSGEDRIVHFLEFQKERQAHKSHVKNFKTGLLQLDGLMGGFETGEMTVISGPTGNGKTLFADSIGQRLMRTEKMKIAWFSYEVPTEKMILKYVRSEDREVLPLYVPMSLKAGSYAWLKNKCLEAQLKHQCEAVFIDHLHFLVDMDTKMNISLNIGAVMRSIKHEIAKGMNLAVFVICHQGQPKDEEPALENIRDSSFIAQESDNVFIVFRSPDPLADELKPNANIRGYQRSYDGGYATVKIEKARREGTYRKKIHYQKLGHWLEEI